MNNEHEKNNPLSASAGEGQGEVAQSSISDLQSPIIYSYTRSQAIAEGFQTRFFHAVIIRGFATISLLQLPAMIVFHLPGFSPL